MSLDCTPIMKQREYIEGFRMSARKAFPYPISVCCFFSAPREYRSFVPPNIIRSKINNDSDLCFRQVLRAFKSQRVCTWQSHSVSRRQHVRTRFWKYETRIWTGVDSTAVKVFYFREIALHHDVVDGQLPIIRQKENAFHRIGGFQ